ncbi:MAG TPA: riboflavin synthase, partial [Archaeoglobus profundus]|nr:riboflavin synthase [Archaeoglobus profundus]
RNAVDLLLNPKRLQKLAGTGQRQGFPDVGPILR